MFPYRDGFVNHLFPRILAVQKDNTSLCLSNPHSHGLKDKYRTGFVRYPQEQFHEGFVGGIHTLLVETADSTVLLIPPVGMLLLTFNLDIDYATSQE